jgi:hypothetical protein
MLISGLKGKSRTPSSIAADSRRFLFSQKPWHSMQPSPAFVLTAEPIATHSIAAA